MEKTNERKAYCAPQCMIVRLKDEDLMQSTSFNNGAGHQKAGDDGTLNAKKSFVFEDEDENETNWYNE